MMRTAKTIIFNYFYNLEKIVVNNINIIIVSDQRIVNLDFNWFHFNSFAVCYLS